MRLFGAQSETAPLKRVLMHRPGAELDLVTRANADDSSFLGPVNRAKFTAAFDTLAAHLRSEKIDVVLLTDVLKNEPDALAYIARRPNMVYQRDLSTVLDGGAVLWRMAMVARKWDTWIVKKAHEKLGIPILAELPYPELLEGGGVTFLTPRVMLASLCDRATEGAFHFLAGKLLGKHLDAIVMTPTTQGIFHIDGQFLMCGEKLAFIFRRDINLHPSTVFTRRGSRHVWFDDYLNELGIECIELTEKERDEGALNCIQTAPLRWVGFDSAKRLGAEMAKRGGKAYHFPRKPVLNGKGGAHCMTCPLLREY